MYAAAHQHYYGDDIGSAFSKVLRNGVRFLKVPPFSPLCPITLTLRLRYDDDHDDDEDLTLAHEHSPRSHKLANTNIYIYIINPSCLLKTTIMGYF